MAALLDTATRGAKSGPGRQAYSEGPRGTGEGWLRLAAHGCLRDNRIAIRNRAAARRGHQEETRVLPLSMDFFARPVVSVARALIGTRLLLDGVGGRIVETEAYARDDAASHAFRGQTPRNAAMFGPPGRAYVYRSYGIHWCFNIVCGEGPGDAVLIRALEPEIGLDSMRARRGLEAPVLLCSGPGRLCQALGITLGHNGMPVDEPPFELHLAGAASEILSGPRIGITKNIEPHWRFGLKGSPHLSRRFA